MTAKYDDITDFLAAQYDAEEQLARDGAGYHSGEWTASRGRGIYLHDDGPHLDAADGDGDWVKRVNIGVWLCDDPADDCETMRATWTAQVEHAAYWDPQRVLADLAAKRQVLAIHRTVREVWTEDIGPTDEPYLAPDLMDPGVERGEGCVSCHDTGCGNVAPDGPCETLKALVSPYAGLPGFKPEWRVDG